MSWPRTLATRWMESRRHIGDVDAVLVTESASSKWPTATRASRSASTETSAGVVVPRLLNSHGLSRMSCRREPRLARARRRAVRPAARRAGCAQLDTNGAVPTNTTRNRSVECAALLIDAELDRRVGRCNERFFLDSKRSTSCAGGCAEEGSQILVRAPDAMMRHRQGGSQLFLCA